MAKLVQILTDVPQILGEERGRREGGERGELKKMPHMKRPKSTEKQPHTMRALVAAATEKVVLDTDSISNSKPLPHLLPHLHHLYTQTERWLEKWRK